MTASFTNNHKVSLALAVWLVDDTYDYNPAEKYISITGLMKPIRHIILPSRIHQENHVLPDVTDMVSRAMGVALHDSIEKAWIHRYRKNLAKLGFSQNIIDRIKINPEPEDLKKDDIPIYIEQRAIREVNGWKVGGKFDLVTNGVLQDNKSTSVYAYMNDSRQNDYIKQGSCYKWLNPEKITEEFLRINFIFTDWTAREAKAKPDVYPTHRVMHKEYPLDSVEVTEQWIAHRLALIEKYSNAPEEEIPHCTPEELWQSDPVYKYYSDPAKAIPSNRSTRTFTDKAEAHMFFAEKKGKGALLTIEGRPRRCDYCDAFPVCTQKEKWQDD